MSLLPSDIEQIQRHIRNKEAQNPGFAKTRTKEILLRCIETDKPLPTADEFAALLKTRRHPEPMQQKMSIWLLWVLVPGLDETADPGASYRGFRFRSAGDGLLKAAQTAYADVKQAAVWCDAFISKLAALRDGAGTEEQAWTLKQYKVYFDATVDKTRLERVKSVFSRANQAINKESFEFLCEADNQATEHVIYGGNPMDRIHAFVRKTEGLNRIYLSSMFFAPTDVPFRGAGTLMHELSHLPKVGDTEDEIPIDATTEKCLALAAKSPDQACNNAENYGLFAMKVLSKLKKGGLLAQ